MKTSEFLIESKKLIDTPYKWTQNALARDKNGNEVSHVRESAVCFCSIGALCHTWATKEDANSYNIPAAEEYLLKSRDDTSYSSISVYNDTHTHVEVMEWWDKAIAAAIKDESEGH